ncbi:MAG: class I SAM-dependent methyltransferase [Syntrophomonadaceae bacterium]|nr:class I SAM-dependent methyltransferase [Syntrophomonadaceae bacterium]
MAASINRLKAVADMLIKNKAAADIGADHAWLSIYLIENGLAPRVIIGELGDGPLERAVQAVHKNNLQEQVELRQGNGLQVLEAGEVASIAIAGMGGDTILEILAYDWAKARSFERFVFQPMSKSGVLRRELASQGWKIIEERVLQENGRFFVVIASEPADIPYELSDLEIDIGPFILKADNNLKKMFINVYLEKYRRVFSGLSNSKGGQNQNLLFAYQNKIKGLEAILGVKQG